MKEKKFCSREDIVSGSTKELFCLALDAEQEALGFYRYLQAGFAYREAASLFWGQMAADEYDHVEELKQIYQSLSEAQLAEPADPRILAKARQSANFGLMDKALAIKNLDQAYELAHELENSEIMTVFSFIREHYISYIQQKNFTLSVLEKHLDRIMNAADVLGFSPQRRAVLLRPPK